MIGLIRKDFYLNRKIIYSFLTMCLVYAVMMTIASVFILSLSDEGSVNIQFFSVINTAMFFICAMSIQNIMALADMGKKTRYYFCASPVGIKGVVAEGDAADVSPADSEGAGGVDGVFRLAPGIDFSAQDLRNIMNLHDSDSQFSLFFIINVSCILP